MKLEHCQQTLFLTCLNKTIRPQARTSVTAIGIASARLIRLKPTYICKSYSSLSLSIPIPVFPRIVLRAVLFFVENYVSTIRDCSSNRGCSTIRSRLKLYANSIFI